VRAVEVGAANVSIGRPNWYAVVREAERDVDDRRGAGEGDIGVGPFGVKTERGCCQKGGSEGGLHASSLSFEGETLA